MNRIRILSGFTALSDVKEEIMSLIDTFLVISIDIAPIKGIIQKMGTVVFFMVTDGLKNATAISNTQVRAEIIKTVIICHSPFANF